MSRSGTSKRRPLGRRGATSLEMALVASTLMLLLLGGVDIGRYFFVSESVKYLVGELGRNAMVYPKRDWNTEKSVYVSRIPILSLAQFTTLTVDVVNASAPLPTTVVVTAVYPYTFNLPWLSSFNTSITSRARLSFLAP